MTHLVGKAAGYALTEVPELNVRLARGRVHSRSSVDVFFAVSTGNGTDLTGVKIEHVDRKSSSELARELEMRVSAIHRGDDADFGRSKKMLAVLPPWLLRAAFRPEAIVCAVRVLMRHRDELVQIASQHVQHIHIKFKIKCAKRT